MNRADILNTARDCVTRDRAATHGEAEDNFTWIAGHWNWWLQDKLEPGASITPYDVAQMMVGFKQARAKGNPAFHDNAIDAVGYSALAGEIGAKQARSATERPATAPQAPSAAQDTRQPVPGVWALNSYTALHERLIGSTHDTQDGALFPSGWTPEMEERA